MSDKKTKITIIEERPDLDAAELRRIIDIVTGAYSEAGKDILLGVLDRGDGDIDLIIDNRDPDLIN